METKKFLEETLSDLYDGLQGEIECYEKICGELQNVKGKIGGRVRLVSAIEGVNNLTINLDFNSQEREIIFFEEKLECSMGVITNYVDRIKKAESMLKNMESENK